MSDLVNNEIKEAVKNWTKEDVIEQIKSWHFGNEFFLEEHIGGDTSLQDQLEASKESLAIVIEFINSRCGD